ncbi:fructose-1,6-bisphosphatase I [Halobiforma haloterrestris]|uniref:Fructose-1,6-bisphosphatase class 1 n=1 Tax=Natronobacterium haloterrestre TaxID=148448 RepID=A0A1I1EKH7_NATHA|nr:hypothetical protein [Halobiforma haloterrestris]SFB87669.1 fructose-1,6-bisphosphatase I [Halobiforma haloterrestris]
MTGGEPSAALGLGPDCERVLDRVATVASDAAAALPELYRREFRSTTGAEANAANPTGDDQSTADRWLDDRFREALEPLEAVGAYASEERSAVRDCGTGYGIAIDPLDGSGNLASNNAVGAVLGIYDADATLPAPGTELVASVIVVFGPYVAMTVAADDDVARYTVADGERTDPRPVSLPAADEAGTDDAGLEEGDGPSHETGDEGEADEHAEICGFSGRRADLPPSLLERLDDLRATRRLRYSGAAVADVAALLEHGGVLCYPGSDRRPDGVLRLQYEANPIAHVVEAAGGRAIDDEGPLLERSPDGLHERVPVFVGSPEPIDRVAATLSEQ